MMTLEEIELQLEALGLETMGSYFDMGHQYGIAIRREGKPIHATRMRIAKANDVSGEEIRELKYGLLSWFKRNNGIEIGRI